MTMVDQDLAWQYSSMIDVKRTISESKSFNELLRYGLIGLILNLTGYMIYLLVTYLGVEHKIAMSFLYVVGVLFGFYLNRKHTFKHDGHISGAIFRYAFVYMIGYMINLTMLYIMVDKIGYKHQYVQLASIILLVGYFFLSMKLFVFREKKTDVMVNE